MTGAAASPGVVGALGVWVGYRGYGLGIGGMGWVWGVWGAMSGPPMFLVLAGDEVAHERDALVGVRPGLLDEAVAGAREMRALD